MNIQSGTKDLKTENFINYVTGRSAGTDFNHTIIVQNTVQTSELEVQKVLWKVTVLYVDILIWHSNSWGSLWGNTTRNKLCSLWSTGSYELISWNKHLPADIQDDTDKDPKTSYEWNLYSHHLCQKSSITHFHINWKKDSSEENNFSFERETGENKLKCIFWIGFHCSCFNLQKRLSSFCITLIIAFVFPSYWQWTWNTQ